MHFSKLMVPFFSLSYLGVEKTKQRKGRGPPGIKRKVMQEEDTSSKLNYASFQ